MPYRCIACGAELGGEEAFREHVLAHASSPGDPARARAVEVARERPVEFRVREGPDYVVVEVRPLRDGLRPSDLRGVVPPPIPFDKGVVLAGRAPSWLFCYLARAYYFAPWLAIYDPRLGAAVVFESHVPEVREGSVRRVPGL